MSGLPQAVADAVAGLPVVGQLDQAFVLLTADRDGPIDVCLLSRTELRARGDRLSVVTRSSKARHNLAATGRATLIAVVGDEAHYVALGLRRRLEEDGALAAELEVERALRDSLGVALQPLAFRVEPHLEVEERWDRTSALLDRLEREAPAGPAGSPRR